MSIYIKKSVHTVCIENFIICGCIWFDVASCSIYRHHLRPELVHGLSLSPPPDVSDKIMFIFT